VYKSLNCNPPTAFFERRCQCDLNWCSRHVVLQEVLFCFPGAIFLFRRTFKGPLETAVMSVTFSLGQCYGCSTKLIWFVASESAIDELVAPSTTRKKQQMRVFQCYL
jgi:hypothetical protein